MCGNGGRCIILMAYSLGYTDETCSFLAADGPHEGKVTDRVELKMQPVSEVFQKSKSAFFVNTGSPHYVEFVDSVDDINIIQRAQAIRYNEEYKEVGTNVNFVEVRPDFELAIRTYERGVEGETLACGTGIVAASLVHNHLRNETKDVRVAAVGGNCRVRMEQEYEGWKNIWLIGPAKEVFSGVIAL